MKGTPKYNIQPLKLFEDDEIARPIVPPEQVAEPGNGGATFSDPAFASNKSLPIHRWVPWIAGFSSDFVRASLQQYLPERGIVLDPFAGVGTTLLEAVLLGHQAIGFEINPYAALASKVKLNACHISTERLRAEIRRLQAFYLQCIASTYLPRSIPR